MTAAAAAAMAAIGVDDEMPDLAGGAGGAGVELPIVHDRAAHAGADEDAEEIRRQPLPAPNVPSPTAATWTSFNSAAGTS